MRARAHACGCVFTFCARGAISITMKRQYPHEHYPSRHITAYRENSSVPNYYERKRLTGDRREKRCTHDGNRHAEEPHIISLFSSPLPLLPSSSTGPRLRGPAGPRTAAAYDPVRIVLRISRVPRSASLCSTATDPVGKGKGAATTTREYTTRAGRTERTYERTN